MDCVCLPLLPKGPTASAELTLQDVAAQAGLKTLDVLYQECCIKSAPSKSS